MPEPKEAAPSVLNDEDNDEAFDAGRMSLRKNLRTMASDAAKILRLARTAAPSALGWIAAAAVVEALGTMCLPYATKRFFDALPEALATHSATIPILWLCVDLALAMSRSVTGQVIRHGTRVLDTSAGPSFTAQVLEKSCRVDYHSFESPRFLNRLTRARQDAAIHCVPYAMQSIAIGRAMLTFVGCVVLLIVVAPLWTLPIAFFAFAPPFLVDLTRARRSFDIDRKNAYRNRQGWYVESLLTSADSVKEVRALAIGNWLVKMYRRLHHPFRDSHISLSKEYLVRATSILLLADFIFYLPFMYFMLLTAAGKATVGALLFLFIAFHQSAASLKQMLAAFSNAFEQHLYVRNFLEVLDYEEVETAASPNADNILEKAPEFIIDDLWFAYPGSDRHVLRGLSLDVRAGETVAIVGRNGIGKTTLVKLLLGLYSYNLGRITLGGIDISKRTVGWRRDNIGVILQDFARYAFSINENVGVGWSPDLHNEKLLNQALHKAGAEALINELARGGETPLGPAFGGKDLSGGQWQRVALARLFMRRSRLWIMDEPTAAMDPESEERTFEYFRKLKEGRTALIITHRFATARLADRIAVVDEGRVSELGTHDELLALNGHYARIFKMQARAYASHRDTLTVPRAAFVENVTFNLVGSLEQLTGKSRDISVGGMLIETEQPLPRDSSVTVRVKLPGRKEPSIIQGRVQWTTEGSIGIRFISLEPDEIRLIADMTNMPLSLSSIAVAYGVGESKEF